MHLIIPLNIFCDLLLIVLFDGVYLSRAKVLQKGIGQLAASGEVDALLEMKC